MHTASSESASASSCPHVRRRGHPVAGSLGQARRRHRGPELPQCRRRYCAVQATHCDRFGTLIQLQPRWSKRRQDIEPAIDHAKSDHHILWCWLQGSTGDALHALPLCATCQNLRPLPQQLPAATQRPFFCACLHCGGRWWQRRSGFQRRWSAPRAVAPISRPRSWGRGRRTLGMSRFWSDVPLRDV